MKLDMIKPGEKFHAIATLKHDIPWQFGAWIIGIQENTPEQLVRVEYIVIQDDTTHHRWKLPASEFIGLFKELATDLLQMLDKEGYSGKFSVVDLFSIDTIEEQLKYLEEHNDISMVNPELMHLFSTGEWPK